jgi:hypothetical protein
MAGRGAFRANGRGSCSVVVDSAIIPAAGNLLGADHDAGNLAVITGCSAHGFLATLRRDGAWSRRRCHRGELLRAARRCIRYWRVRPGIDLRRHAIGPARVSLRRNYAGHHPIGAEDGTGVAICLSPVRRSVHRNCGGSDIDARLAGECIPDARQNVNFSFPPRPWLAASTYPCLKNVG